MIKSFITIFLFLLLIADVKSDNWWHCKPVIKDCRSPESDYEIINQHRDCNCTGINFNKSLIEVEKTKVNSKFIKLFNKFLK